MPIWIMQDNKIGTIINIIDLIIILLIIIFTVHNNYKKRNNKNTNNNTYIDEHKWFIVENSIQHNIKKYENLKQIISSFISIPIFFILILWIPLLWFLLYDTTVHNSNNLFSLIILIILLIFCFFHFTKSKIVLDKLKKNLAYKILWLYGVMFIVLITIILWWFGWAFIGEILNMDEWQSAGIQLFFIIYSFTAWFSLLKTVFFMNPSKEVLLQDIIKIYISLIISDLIIFIWFFGVPLICEKLELNTRLSAGIELLSIFSSIIYWFFLLLKKNKNPLENRQSKVLIKNETVEDIANNEEIHDKPIYTDKEIESKTWFHAWSLFKDM